jgi:hypothetical protein
LHCTAVEDLPCGTWAAWAGYFYGRRPSVRGRGRIWRGGGLDGGLGLWVDCSVRPGVLLCHVFVPCYCCVTFLSRGTAVSRIQGGRQMRQRTQMRQMMQMRQMGQMRHWRQMRQMRQQRQMRQMRQMRQRRQNVESHTGLLALCRQTARHVV